MSLQVCQGGNTGFPIKLNQTIFDPWPGVKNEDIQKLIVPTDVEVAWAPASSANITATYVNQIYHIGGFDSIASGTTLTLGGARYRCSPVLTLCGIQHARLSYAKDVTNEIILVFTIETKNDNPSSPDMVFMCRPAILTDKKEMSIQLWSSVNSAVKNKSASNLSGFDLSTLFAYNREVMMPMMSYETCIATRLIGGPNAATEGSAKIRVVVCSQPMYIYAESNGTGKCDRVTKYTVPDRDGMRLLNVFQQSGASSYTNIQFTDRKSDNGKTNEFPTIPSPIANYLVLGLSGNMVDNWEGALQAFEYLIPDVFLGKSLASIARSTVPPEKKTGKKAFKCYTIDPRKDVVNDQIMIDPTTGEPLKDTMDALNRSSAGGDPALAMALGGQAVESSGIQPADIEDVFVYIFSLIGGISLLSYLFYIIRHFMAHRYSEGIAHIVSFIICFLILFAITYNLEKDSENKRSKGKKSVNTGYVMYGDDIKGEIPVTKIFKGVRIGPTMADVYLAQDANIVHALCIMPTEVGRNNSFKFNGDASSIQTFEEKEILQKYSEYINNNPDEFRPGTKRKDYKIKQV